jgi:uncharacterized protein YjbI with pentapeptide repeats
MPQSEASNDHSTGNEAEPQEVEVVSAFGDELLEKVFVPTDAEELVSISGEEAAALLRQGQPLVRKRIIGDVDLGQQGLVNPFEFEVDGKKIVMAGLPAPRPRERTPFVKSIELRECWCEGKVNLAGLWFRDIILVSGTRFCSEVDFQNSFFDKAVVLTGCRFEGRLNFVDTILKGSLECDRTIFIGPADFYHATFGSGGGFSNAQFHAPCNFSAARFLSALLVTPCLQFDKVICHEAAFFRKSAFRGLADFSHSQFRRRAEFSDAQFRYVNFAKAEFGWLELKWEQIEGGRLLFGPVILEGFTPKPAVTQEEFDEYFEKRMEPPLPETHRQYDILKGIFLRQGDFVSADACFYEWKQTERRKSALGWNPEYWIVKAFHYLNWLTCGYGVKPIRTVLFASVVILLFGVAFAMVDASVSLLPAKGSLFAGLLGNIALSFQAFMNFVPAAAGVGSLTRSLLLLERVLGWFTLLLFVTTYTRIMLR